MQPGERLLSQLLVGDLGDVDGHGSSGSKRSSARRLLAGHIGPPRDGAGYGYAAARVTDPPQWVR